MNAKSWYSPTALTHFRQSHIRFALEHLAELAEGNYPLRPSGYSAGTPIQTSLRPGARFTRIVEIHAELTARIDRCGVDGDILLLHYEDGLRMERIAAHLRKVWRRPIGEQAIRRRINRVIRYCVGEERRIESYYKWRRQGEPI